MSPYRKKQQDPPEDIDKGKLQEQFLVLQAASRIAHQLSKAAELQPAIENLMAEFVDLAKADEGSIQLLRPSTGTTRCTLVRRKENSGGLLDKQLDDFMTGWVVKKKGTLLSSDLLSLLESDSVPKRYSSVRSFLAAPLLTDDETIGVVNLIRTGERDVFTSTDKRMVSSLAAQIGDFIEGAALREKLFVEKERLQRDLEHRFSIHGIIGQSPAIKAVFALLERVIPTDVRVVINGESGTGKELIARSIHYAGPRKDRPFVAVDCGALPAALLESELFGYVRGAFTGAVRDRQGLIEAAHTGTLFLDEVTNMNLETQVKLLRMLQEGEIRPLGSNQSKQVDVRIIAAASVELEQAVSSGVFRSDLYYRLNVMSIQSPPLRERVEDIPLLGARFLERFSEKHGKSVRQISPRALQILEQYAWPGNIRELENVVERSVVMTNPDEITLLPKHLPIELSSPGASEYPTQFPLEGDLPSLLTDYEREILLRVLGHHDWNQTAAARALNISEAVIRYKIKRLRLFRPD